MVEQCREEAFAQEVGVEHPAKVMVMAKVMVTALVMVMATALVMVMVIVKVMESEVMVMPLACQTKHHLSRALAAVGLRTQQRAGRCLLVTCRCFLEAGHVHRVVRLVKLLTTRVLSN